MIKSGATVVTDNTKKLLEAVAALTKKQVLVGIPEEKTEREDGDTPITNAALAYIHTNGAPEANIPARPFLEPGIKGIQAKINDRLGKAGKAALDGNLAETERQLASVGLEAQLAAQRKINEGIPPPLADSTLEARKRAGFAGTKPLIRTTQLRNAITFVLRERKS